MVLILFILLSFFLYHLINVISLTLFYQIYYSTFINKIIFSIITQVAGYMILGLGYENVMIGISEVVHVCDN